MPRLLTAGLFLALACLTATAQDKSEGKDVPKSDNKDKILGKWKFTALPEGVTGAAELKQAEALGIYVYCEFKKDGVFDIGAWSEKPELQQALQGKAGAAAQGKYKLLAGDGVEFYDLPKQFAAGFAGKDKKAKTKVKIDRDAMTWTDEDGKTAKLTRLKEKKDDKKEPPVEKK